MANRIYDGLRGERVVELDGGYSDSSGKKSVRALRVNLYNNQRTIKDLIPVISIEGIDDIEALRNYLTWVKETEEREEGRFVVNSEGVREFVKGLEGKTE